MNTRYIGPNLYLAPDADPGDGCFDVVLVTEAERGKFAEYLSSWQKGRMREPSLPGRRGEHLQLQWSGFELHLDDKVWPDGAVPDPASSAIDVRIEAGALEFLVPD
jgi:diacylglycerol kinase family enzyme